MAYLRPVPDDPSGASSGTTLADLLRRSSLGDQQAFAQLYDATSARLFGLALRVVRNPALAEEVTQEAFLEIWRQAARFDADRGSALAWMTTITHRRAVDRVRAAEAAGRREQLYEQRVSAVDHDSTAEAAHIELEAVRVRSALATLTTTQREAVSLAYLGGYTHTEVASMLDLPVGTAKTRIRDGLIRLRDNLGVESGR